MPKGASRPEINPIRSAIGELALPGEPRALDVVPADLGPAASAMGAIALVLKEQDPLPPGPTPADP